MDFRYASTTGEAHGNVLSSVIRTRDSGTFTAGTNLMNVTSATWDSWYVAPLAGDLRVEGNVSQLIGGAAARSAVTDDHCARPRPSSGAYTLGALEHSLGDCGTGTGTPTDGGTSADAGTGMGGDGGTGGGTDGGSDAGTGGGPSTVNDEPKDDKGGCSTSPGLAAIFLSLLVPVVLRRRPRQHAHEG